jgi:hypothetical protein
LKNPFDEIVNRKDKHINKYLHDPLPEPEIQADDAWTQMNDMLYPNSAGVSQSIAGKVAKYVSQFKWSLLTGLGGISLSLFIILSPDSNVITGKTKKEKQTIDSVKISEVLPGNATGEDGNPELKAVNGNVIKKQGNRDLAQKADPVSQTVSTNDPVILKNEKGIATIEKHVNVSHSHEKKTSNVSKKPDLSVQSRNAEIRQSVINDPISMRNLFRSGEAAGRSSHINDGVTPDLAKEFNAPGFQNSSAIIPSVGKNLIIELKSLSFHAKPFQTDWSKKIKAPKMPVPAQAAEHKKTSNLPIHFGLEWTLNTPLQRTDYLFTGTDSVRRPARLLIPGIFISKNWAKHTVSFSFSPYQPYFGNNKRVQQLSDTIAGSDSAKIFYNANLIKASGMNFTFQYQYQVFGPLLLNAGLSYSTFSSALIRKETENRFGQILQGPLVTVKKSGELRSYINPGFFALKAGLAVRPALWQGRIQAGFNVILPLSNISSSAENPVRALNGQVYLRLNLYSK